MYWYGKYTRWIFQRQNIPSERLARGQRGGPVFLFVGWSHARTPPALQKLICLMACSKSVARSFAENGTNYRSTKVDGINETGARFTKVELVPINPKFEDRNKNQSLHFLKHKQETSFSLEFGTFLRIPSNDVHFVRHSCSTWAAHPKSIHNGE